MKEYNIEDYLNPELSKEIIEELVKENRDLKVKNNKLKERLRIIKDITENGCYPEFEKLLEECE